MRVSKIIHKRFKRREHAIHCLQNLHRNFYQTKDTLREVKVEGEEVSPLENWMLWQLDYLIEQKLQARTVLSRFGEARFKALKSVARSLDLYPIPSWYYVRKRILFSINPMHDWQEEMARLRETFNQTAGMKVL